MIQPGQRVAVIGAGISGLASAYFLARQHHVTLFEQAPYLGGHTNTVDVTLDGRSHPVDTGFLVFNENTYPNLIALFAELNVETYATDMSFGVSMDHGKLEWAGTNLDSVFAQRRNVFSPTFWTMLKDIVRFNKAATGYLERCGKSQETLGQLLVAEKYSDTFCDNYLLPMAAAIWSSAPADILNYPASSFIRFCLNHSLLQINNRPQWQTVQGGGRAYVRKIAATLPDIRLNTAVHAVRRDAQGAMVMSAGVNERYDAVVFASHAPHTLDLLVDADASERRILSAVHYQPNRAYLHTDQSLMPRRKKVWSAWNYLGDKAKHQQPNVCVSYWLNQLQQLPFSTPLILTLNPPVAPADSSIHGVFDYEHPLFDQTAIRAQQQLSSIQGKNKCWFAGAWTGYGFHEDGLKSALRVIADFGVKPDWARL